MSEEDDELNGVYCGILLMAAIASGMTMYFMESSPILWGLGAFVVGVIVAWVFFLPIIIAISNESPALSRVVLLTAVGIFLPVTWIVALVWSFKQ